MPSLVPIDHDPFNGEPSQLQLAPVDYDPFAAEKFANPAVKGVIGSLATLPQRVIQNSQYSLDSGNYDPSAPVEAAMTAMTGGLAGTAEGGVALGSGPIRAYHGSPHDFDAFSMDKIGTGEGAQAYGHGLYFAEKEATAKSYRDALTDAVPTSGNAHVQSIGGKYHVVDDFGVQAGPFDTKEAAQASMSKQQGKMYEVNINADPEHFLDWDKPLSQQPKAARDILKLPPQAERLNQALIAKGHPEMTAGNAYTEIRNAGLDKGQAALTEQLREAGIPGIKYLDQGSRASGDGSRNYVVFNHDLINIVRKYAAAGIALPPAIAAEYQRQYKPVDHDPFASQ